MGDEVMFHLSGLLLQCHLLPQHRSRRCIFTYSIYLHNYLHNYHNEKCIQPMLCGIWTCTEPTVSEQALNVRRCMFTYNILNPLSPFSLPLLPPIICSLFFLFCCLLFVLSLPPCTPHLPQHQHERCRTYYQCARVCVCIWPTVPLLKAPNTIRTSPSDLPHLLSRQVVSTPGGELSFSLCLSVSLNLSLPRLFYTHTQTVCTHHCTRIQSACYWDICQSVGWLTSVIQL